MGQPKFTKRHYKVVAGTIMTSLHEADVAFSNSERVVAHSVLKLFAENAALEFHYDNEKFDKDKFMVACGLQEGAKQ